ncbi:MAG: hypothetical protein AAF628_22055 [Planctomycetota bacterium]
MHLIGKVRAAGRKTDRDAAIDRLVIAYPGLGVGTAERKELLELVGSLRTAGAAPGAEPNAPEIELTTHERLEETLSGKLDHARHLRVCLSGGGDDPDLFLAGISTEQVEDLLVRLARRLLESGCYLHYGGTLADLQTKLTQSLIDAANGWAREQEGAADPQAPPPSAGDLEDPPFVNYASWPQDARVTLRHRAHLAGICRFQSVLPAGLAREQLPSQPDVAGDLDHLRLAADALTSMRDQSSRDTQLRIVVAGKIRGALGWLPGIAEEVLCSLEAGQPPLILGGWGGCAGMLADFLRDPAAPWPKALTLDVQAEVPGSALQRLAAHAEHRQCAVRRFAQLRRRVSDYRARLHDAKRWPGGDELREIALALLGPSSDGARAPGVAATINRCLHAAQLVPTRSS